MKKKGGAHQSDVICYNFRTIFFSPNADETSDEQDLLWPCYMSKAQMLALPTTRLRIEGAQSVEQSLPTPEIRGSNPVIGKLNLLSTY